MNETIGIVLIISAVATLVVGAILMAVVSAIVGAVVLLVGLFDLAIGIAFRSGTFGSG